MKLCITLAVLSCASALHGQLKPVTPADFGKFETLGPGALGPDGKWLAYVVNRSSRDNELRIANVASGVTKTAPFGTNAVFSSNGRWLAYTLGQSEAAQEKLRKDKKPVHNKVGLMDLSSGEQTAIEGIESLQFSPDGAFLAMRRYAPEKPPAAGAPADAAPDPDAPPAGATLIVRQLATGRDSSFGNVSEFAWQDLPKTGHLLAFATSVEDKTGNGVQLLDPAAGRIRVLDSGPAVFSGLAWRKKGNDLAVLRSQTDESHEGPTQIALAWTHLGEPSEAAHRIDAVAANSLLPGTRVVAYRKPSWSEDGETVFLGAAPWMAKIKGSKEPEEQPSVDVWHWRDPEVQPKQKLGAKNDRQKNLLIGWDLGANKAVRLGQAATEEVTPLKHGKTAYAANWTSYAMERSIGRPAADLYLVDEGTGARTKIKDGIAEDRLIQASPGGRYLLFVQDDHYWTVDTQTHALVNITRNVPTSFIDRESDFTVKQKPPFGVAGWLAGDAAVILYDKFDLWQIAPDGGKAVKLTDGAKGEIRHRYVRLDPNEEYIDMTKQVYLSLFGTWTKESGYARLVNGREEQLLLTNKSVTRLMKAQDAPVFALAEESFEQAPNYYVAGGELRDARKVTNLDPFQSQYAWGRSELVEYKNAAGKRLQGALYYPAGYEAGKKYPMVVYMYERLSDNVHHYSAPSERDYYNPGAITAHGYFLLMPDIVFRPREPGVSVADCVTAAVNAVVAKGAVDAKRIGVMGHSWGGFDSVYLATHTHTFAAAVAGAPITDLVSNYGNHHWSNGIAETDHIETGQQRMEVPLWEDLPAYIRNSAVFGAQTMITPLLIEVGDADGTVFFHQGVELYNVARRAKKPVVLVVYAGEDHSLRKKPNQIDYQRRIFAWFDHYLKGETGLPWITEGETYLDHQRTLQVAKGATEPAEK